MKTLAISILLAASTAAADPSFEVLDRGTAIEVIAHEVKASKTVVNPVRSRLEIDITGTPHGVPLVPTSSAVKVVEFDGQTSRVLSVKLPLERPQVKQMAKFAQAVQVGDDLHLLFPKELPADGAKVSLPEPTVPASLEAKAKAMAPPVTPFGPQKPRADKAPATEPTAAATTAPSEIKAEPAKRKDDKPEKFTADEEPSSNASMYAMLGLGALGIGAWMLKKKRGATKAPTSSIEMIAQRSLGAKAKVVWLAAGGREMVVAVTPQSVRMLGQWKKNEGTASASSSMTALPEATAFEHKPRERAVTNSPVAGILKLRERMPTNNKVEVELLDEEIATGDLDADAIWAKEILAASGGRR